ncbi:hypothetical protein TNCT_91021 [Trichonephila clavata]|uniref:Uncharacterized protein n=1 Tax=Trichonephila clavata TaxID=2740835 RepID=A0A8X6KWS0_TRICU|nr:hypothetical protein TNCT_91021 [Trichonephila clavata]
MLPHKTSDVLRQMSAEILSSHLLVMYRVTRQHLASQLFTQILYRGQVRGSRLSINECENDVQSLELFKLHAEEYYFAENLHQENHLEKISRGVEECHQHNTGPLRLYVP